MFKSFDNLFLEFDGSAKKSVSIRNFVQKPREVLAYAGPTPPGMSYSFFASGKIAEKNIQVLIKNSIVKKIENDKDKQYDYRLKLTDDGKRLRTIVVSLNAL